MSKGLRYNEDSWKIDVITEICQYVSTKKINITKATGEYTITSVRKFPDVLLLGGESGNIALQGWELKMPDTPITADDPLIPAEEKARALNLNSFVVWNASEAALYLKDEDDIFQVIRSWSIPEIRTRLDVEEKRSLWVSLLHTMIDEINSLMSGHEIKSIPAVDTINGAMYERFVSDLTPHIVDNLKSKTKANRTFNAEIESWWNYSHAEYPNEDKLEVLSKIIVISWMNKLLFAHSLKKNFNVAWAVDDIEVDTSIDDAKTIFNQISNECGYSSIFSEELGDDCLDEYSWSCLIELNRYLKTISIDKVSQDNLQAMLTNVVSQSRRVSAGQFSTPKPLARLLVELTMDDLFWTVYDPCCGTGTIINEARCLKHENGLEDRSTVWASDKFSYPLKLASISLTDPDSGDDLIQIFEKDVFDVYPGMKVELIDPKTGNPVQRKLDPVDCVVSNLPFVKFEIIKESNPNVKSVIDNKKHDLYADVAIKIADMIRDGGRLGIITSNSWLCTDWGAPFKEELIKRFHIERVVISQSGRWFKNADVVTTILVLKKRSEINPDEKTQYVAIAEKIEDWSNEALLTRIISDILTNNVDSESVYIHNYSESDLERIKQLGLGPMALFSKISWIDKIDGLTIPASDVFTIARGSRRGWDEMFYPKENSGIEEEYLQPVVLSSKSFKKLVMEPDGKAFCCSCGIEYLESHHHKGALRWISMFQGMNNKTGQPLVQTLARKNMFWYELSADEVADLAISINPDARPCVFKLKERCFVNQRLIRLTIDTNDDLDLLHALMNTTLGILMIESQGFGRGLGVLDLSSSRMKKSYMIFNPKLFKDDKSRILEAFQPLLDREMKELPEELVMEDRIYFDEVVLDSLGISEIREDISNTLLEIYHIRKAVNN